MWQFYSLNLFTFFVFIPFIHETRLTYNTYTSRMLSWPQDSIYICMVQNSLWHKEDILHVLNPSYQRVPGLRFGNNFYLVANNQFSANQFYIAASTNQKRDVFARDGEVWRRKSSFRPVSLSFSGGSWFRGLVLVSCNLPVPLLIAIVSFAVANCRVITVGGLVVKRCTSLIPVTDSPFKVELACFANWNE